jgi:hypothetical protein
MMALIVIMFSLFLIVFLLFYRDVQKQKVVWNGLAVIYWIFVFTVGFLYVKVIFYKGVLKQLLTNSEVWGYKELIEKPENDNWLYKIFNYVRFWVDSDVNPNAIYIVICICAFLSVFIFSLAWIMKESSGSKT